jgi:serine protease Do
MKHLFLSNLRRVILAAICVVLAGPVPLSAQPSLFSKDHERASPAIMKIFRKVVAGPSESTVRILCNGKNVALGAVVDPDGLILTKNSVLEGDIKCVLKDGRVLPAEVLGEQEGFDLALLKIPAKELQPVKWRPAKELKQGMWLASVSPKAEPLAIGVVGVLPRKLVVGDQPPKAGSKSGYLGVILEDAEHGAKIKSLLPDGAAAKAGMKVDDVVIEAASRTVTSVESMQSAVQAHKPGEEILVKVLRGKETIEIKATLGKAPQQFQGNPQELMGSELSDRRGGFPTILQHDTVILPRDCGGPVVDLDGNAVGINISRAGRTETYAIPSEAVLSLLDDLKSGKLKKVALPAPFKIVETLQAKGKLTDKDELDTVRSKSFHQVHTVKLVAGAEYTIDLKSGAFNAYLRLEDASGKQLAEDDDSGGNRNARIVFRAPADGEYKVIVTTSVEGEMGDYAVTVRQTGPPKK